MAQTERSKENGPRTVEPVRRKSRNWIAWLAAGVLAVGLLGWTDSIIRPMVETAAAREASNFLLELISRSVLEETEKLEEGTLVRLTWDSGGGVSALQTDMQTLNRLQSRITLRIIDGIRACQEQTIQIPLGTLFGGPYLSGRGPSLELRLMPSGLVKTQPENVFDSAGLNQTRHRLVLRIQLTVTALLPGYSAEAAVDTEAVLAETVIVGKAPSAYYGGPVGRAIVGAVREYS